MAETTRQGTVSKVTAHESGTATVTITVTSENPNPPPPTLETDYAYELMDDAQVIVASSAFGDTLTVTADDATPTKAKSVQRP